jgi:hypothetical protein
MSTRIGKVFSPTVLLVALGLLLAGLAFGAYCVNRVVDERRISIGGFLLAGALVLGGAASLSRVFVEGCAACRKRLEELRASFPIAWHDPLVRMLAAGDGRSLAQLACLPPSDAAGARAVVLAESCPACARVCTASVVTEQWADHAWHAARRTDLTELVDARAQALIGALKSRGAPR